MHELRTLIDVSAGTRLPQYEPEIFSDLVLAEYYLRKLCEQYGWYTVPGMAYNYARFVMESCWPEAEAVIAASRYREWYNREFGTNI